MLAGRNFGYLATLMDDGSPHVTPIWVDTDGERILLNTAVGRVKAENVRHDDRVALTVTDAEDPYRHADMRGRVVAFIDGPAAEAHIHKLHRKYHGSGRYPLRPDEQRLLLMIEPEAVWPRD